MKELIEIQALLKAPKDQYNDFAKFKYRSAESILEALKPLLIERGCILTITDDVINLGERYYIKATATISCGKETVSVTAYAREAAEKKGYDAAQLTGSCSSYARKYALNGLFLIDDAKDIDSDNSSDTRPEVKEVKISDIKSAKQEPDVELQAAIIEIQSSKTVESLKSVAENYKSIYGKIASYKEAVNKRYNELNSKQ